ncbi:toxin-antitoxin system YwqK family antitoxin [Streptomyces sp. NPDC021100]|uniref:toxin-antitoxin system YwqK family antitoxin n=1 Tax=Streptomyces sp. NPDC021100 TaxID=3365114 RepID=UPI00379AF12F
MRRDRPTDDQLARVFATVLKEVLSGQGLRNHTGLDMETDDALWEIAKYGPGAPPELVDAARAAFAGQLDGSNAARWRAELARKIGPRRQPVAEPESGPTDTEARGGAEPPVKPLGATPASERAVRVKGDQTSLDEYGRTCYEGELFTGEVEELADDGRTLLLGTYYLGIEHGRQQEWWPDGTKRADGVTIMGAAVGEWRYWHANGRLSELVVFDENGREMTRKRWNALGEVSMDL